MEKEIFSKIKLKKFQKREVSSFLGQNLLYEYALDLLDDERKNAVQENLEKDKNTQTEFIKISNGLQYVELLSEVVVSDKIVEQIINRNTQLHKILNKIKFHQWPLTLKWTLEAFVVVLAMVITLNILPWSKIVHLASDGQNQDLVIAQIDRKKKETVVAQVEPNKAKPDFVDEEVKIDKKVETKVPDKSTDVAVKIVPPVVVPAVTATTTPKPGTATAAATTPTTTSGTTAAAPIKTAEQTESIAETSTAKVAGGFLYRGQLQVTNVEMIAPKLREKISEFGGRKAGEVEIGWKKSNQNYYYHFTIPEAKLSDLEALLKIYSDVKLKKESHPRVMPDGILRIIFTVEEKATNQGTK
jgi:hypothetical protein